jgi:hypothetical protein
MALGRPSPLALIAILVSRPFWSFRRTPIAQIEGLSGRCCGDGRHTKLLILLGPAKRLRDGVRAGTGGAGFRGRGSERTVQANRIRKDALYIGTGTAWTLVLAAPFLFFKSSSAWPISLLSLAAAGLGWAAVLAYALRRERHATDAVAAAAGGTSCAAVDAMAEALIGHMRGACAELRRVDELLGHAIEQLLAAFNSVCEEARTHQAELARAAAAAQGTPAAERLESASARVAREVNGAVTAMQFRDVVGQKLGHVRDELAALEAVLHRIRETAGQSAHSDLAARVDGLLREMQRARAASPVRQELMHAGEVELF